MNRIADLREKRAKLWLEAKRFMDEHRGNDGCLDEVDAKIYEKMEADVVSLGIEIERLESQAHIDREVLKDSMDGKNSHTKESDFCPEKSQDI